MFGDWGKILENLTGEKGDETVKRVSEILTQLEELTGGLQQILANAQEKISQAKNIVASIDSLRKNMGK